MMNTLPTRCFQPTLGLCTATLLIALLSMNVYAQAKEKVSMASGHGNLTTDGEGFPDPEGELRTFSFHAMALKDGTAFGQAQLKNRTNGLRVHVEIDCMLVVDNLAVMSGVVTNSNHEEFFPVNGSVLFAVRDNGEGADDAADTISPLFLISSNPIPDLCRIVVEEEGLPPDEILFPIDGGNIQVK